MWFFIIMEQPSVNYKAKNFPGILTNSHNYSAKKLQNHFESSEKWTRMSVFYKYECHTVVIIKQSCFSRETYICSLHLC